VRINYCPNGHPQDQPYTLHDREGRTGPYCPVCHAPLIRTFGVEPSPLWPVAAVVVGALLAIGAFWAWVWLS
jgi:hypothetical protein